MTKTCKTCGLEKELSEFYPKKHGAHGVRAHCGVPFSGMDIKSLHVDHDHITGKVRGILCRSCNWLIGHSKEDPGTLESAAQYLRNHQENQ